MTRHNSQFSSGRERRSTFLRPRIATHNNYLWLLSTTENIFCRIVIVFDDEGDADVDLFCK